MRGQGEYAYVQDILRRVCSLQERGRVELGKAIIEITSLPIILAFVLEILPVRLERQQTMR